MSVQAENESLDALFKMAENAAPPEGRVMPPLRTYPKSSEAVSVEEAVSRMKQRRTGRLGTIPGGLDDTSENVRIGRAKGPGKGPGKARGDAEDGEGGRLLTVTDVVGSAVQMTLDVGKTHNSKLSAKNPLLSAPSRKAGRPAEELLAATRLGVLEDMKGLLAEVVPGLVAKALEDARAEREGNEGEVEAALGPLEAFLQGSRRVTYLIQGMRFTAGCLCVSVDEREHCAVVVSRMGQDSAFVPQMKSELALEVDGERIPGSMFYFGMRFDLPALGLSFVGFLYDPSEREEEGE